jgi:peptidyl-prolyl cis-trans isomerase C
MIRLAAAVALAACLGLPHLASAQHAGDAARVNGVGIPYERLDRFLTGYLAQRGRNAQGIRHPEAYARYRAEALDQLVDDELLYQEALRAGAAATPEETEVLLAGVRSRHPDPADLARQLDRAGFTEATFAAWGRRQASIRKLLARDVLAGLAVTDDEVRAFHAANPSRFTTPLEVRARHVLRQCEGSAPAAERERARREAEEVRARAAAGEDFGALARRHSQDATADQGGDLGWVRRGRMVPEFEAVAFELPEGGISGVVETVFGFHVIRVEGRRGGEAIPVDAVREEIRAELLAARRDAAVREHVDALRASARIEYAERRSPP